MSLNKYPKFWYILYLNDKPTKQRLYMNEHEAWALNQNLKKGKWVKVKGQ